MERKPAFYIHTNTNTDNNNKHPDPIFFGSHFQSIFDQDNDTNINSILLTKSKTNVLNNKENDSADISRDFLDSSFSINNY